MPDQSKVFECYRDIVKGDADVMLRSGDIDGEVVVGRKIAESVRPCQQPKSSIFQDRRKWGTCRLGISVRPSKRDASPLPVGSAARRR